MPANLFPHKVTIKSKTTAVDAAGGQVPTYNVTYANVAAMVQPVSSSRMFFYERRNIDVSHSIYTSKIVNVNIGDIVTFGTRNFSIKAFRNLLEESRMFVIDALEIISTGDIFQG